MTNPEFPSPAEMGEAGVQFVRQFELRKVLADFEKVLRAVADRDLIPPPSAEAVRRAGESR